MLLEFRLVLFRSKLKNGVVFNNDYEGDPKAGAVKIPVRDDEVAVSDYDKANGINLTSGSTSYTTLTIDKDKAVNELIDGYDSSALPDDVVAERLASAGYTLALSMDKKSITALEETSGVTVSTTKTVSTTSTAYSNVVKARTALPWMGVPTADRWLIAPPEFI